MKIYFSGSIRGGREDASLYHEMIELLKQYGNVLTEHVGDMNLTAMGGDGTSEYIWKRDVSWLNESDIVIAECSTTSLGVGYELAYAESKNIPVHVFFNKSKGHLSAMIGGCPQFNIHYYDTKEELFEIIKTIMG